MRRSLLVLIFLLSFAAIPRGHSQTAAGQPASQGSQASQSAELRATAQRLLATGSTADAAQAAELLLKASEIDERDAAAAKTKVEIQQLQKPAPAESGWKTLVDITPFLSFVIVALGLFINSSQTRAADKEKRDDTAHQRQADADKAVREREADEEKRWTDAITLIQKTEDFSPSAALLSTFLTGSHAALARETAASLMLTAKKFDNFSDLFNTFVEPVTAENLSQVLALLRSVSSAVSPLLQKTWVNNATDVSVLTPEERDSFNLLTQERTFLGTRVASVLRQPRKSLEPIDLSGMGLDDVDLSGADLRNCVSPYTWNIVNLDGADLRGMTNVENTWVYNTAWWHASHIDKRFLDILVVRAPYKAGQLSRAPKGISAEGYRVNLERLKALAAVEAGSGTGGAV